MKTYKAAVLTHPGFEDIAALEVNELIGAKATTAEAGIVKFQTQNQLDLCRLCYLSQSASQVLLQGLQLNPFDIGKRQYEIFGNSSNVSGNLAYALLRAAGYDGRQFLFDPFTRSGAIAIEAAIFSSGFPVNYYRKDSLSSHFSKLPPFSNINFKEFFAVVEEESAAAAVKRAKRSKPKILSSSQLMQNVRFAEKNAKIAGVNKLIKFSRLDISWLDAKLDEHSVDLVVSYPPQFRGGNDNFAAAENEKLQKMYKTFFYQADLFLKENGKVAFSLKDSSWEEVAAAAAKHKFKPKVLRKFQIGSESFELVSFGRT